MHQRRRREPGPAPDVAPERQLSLDPSLSFPSSHFAAPSLSALDEARPLDQERWPLPPPWRRGSVRVGDGASERRSVGRRGGGQRGRRRGPEDGDPGLAPRQVPLERRGEPLLRGGAVLQVVGRASAGGGGARGEHGDADRQRRPERARDRERGLARGVDERGPVLSVANACRARVGVRARSKGGGVGDKKQHVAGLDEVDDGERVEGGGGGSRGVPDGAQRREQEQSRHGRGGSAPGQRQQRRPALGPERRGGAGAVGLHGVCGTEEPRVEAAEAGAHERGPYRRRGRGRSFASPGGAAQRRGGARRQRQHADDPRRRGRGAPRREDLGLFLVPVFVFCFRCKRERRQGGKARCAFCL